MAAPIGSRSPATSPRLPSPPPFPEVQLPPKSPGMPAASAPDTSKPDPQSLRRIRPGTRAADFHGPPLIPLSELDSPFQLQEHLKSLYTHHTHPPSSPSTTPITSTTALEIATPPPSIDRSLWLYELTRLLVLRANDLIVSFFRETPPCSASTCPEMRASEWQYLCAVHEPPKPCCAIDYSCHTLDWAAYILTSQKHFPSRLTLGREEAGGSQAGVRQLTNIIRRVYRIFAHAWFQHRETFEEVEGREGLYVLYKTVCDFYGLIPEENYTIPKEAEGREDEEEAGGDGDRRSPEKVGAVKMERGGGGGGGIGGIGGVGEEEKVGLSRETTQTQRRHKATPSVGSAVGTIQEDEEEKGESPLKDRAAGGGGGEAKGREQAPLAAISKTAELKEQSVGGVAGGVGGEQMSSDDASSVTLVEEAEGDNGFSRPSGIARSNSSDSVATMVKVEEKDEDDE